ncbi:MAG: sigma-70 family RNA polymerase sigma factor [Clostridia bacterium]|nr:sigma-70 family RNA polymerase sigma factor [Clostridia bacterium]
MKRRKSGSVLSDEQIIDLYFAREERAIAETDKKYCEYLHTVAYNILANDQDAEECLQDTYLRTWEAIPPERPNVFHAFLAKITRNLSLNRYEKANRKKRVPEEAHRPLDEVQDFLPDPNGPESELLSATVKRVIAAYLDSTTERRLYIFISRFFYSFTVSQIAGRLGCSTSLVNKELAEIKRELRVCFEKEGIDV